MRPRSRCIDHHDALGRVPSAGGGRSEAGRHIDRLLALVCRSSAGHGVRVHCPRVGRARARPATRTSRGRVQRAWPMKVGADICVMGGGGHVGLPLSLVFASKGKKVRIFDINRKTIDTVLSGGMPFMEKGAEPLLKDVL